MGERRGMKALELWCRRITKDYPGVRITNMTTSWRNGLGFCAIIHHFRPDLIDFDSLRPEDVYKNNALAFETAETSLSVPALLDPQDMVDYEVPDRLSILTYVSQFYQAFVGQQGVPRTDRGSEPQPSPEPSSPAVEKHVATSVRQREPCSVCQLPVFLAERQLIERRLVHRTCFKCARCSSQLSTANYYITEDGQFCCEVCPDEEIGGRVEKTAAVLAHERAVLAGPTEDLLSEDADAVLELASAEEEEESTTTATAAAAAARVAAGAGAGSSSSDSESDSDESGSESGAESRVARRTDVAINGEGRGDGGTGGEGGEGGATNGVTAGAGEHSAKDETERGAAAVAVTSPAAAGSAAASTVKAVNSEVKREEASGSVTPPAPAPRTSSSGPSAASSSSDLLRRTAAAGEDTAGHRLSLVQQRLLQFKAAERPQPAPRRAGATPESSPPAGAVAGAAETASCGQRPLKPAGRTLDGAEQTADSGDCGDAVTKDADTKDAPMEESSNPFGDDEDEGEGDKEKGEGEKEKDEGEKEKDELNPFGSDDDEPIGEAHSTEGAEATADGASSGGSVYPKLPSEEPTEAPSVVSSSEAADVRKPESAERPDIPVVAVTEPTPPKPAPPKEYNPFDEDDDDEEEAEAEPATATPPGVGVKSEPAEEQQEEEEEEYPDDLNPFGDDDEGEPAAPAAAPAPVAGKPAKPPSLNPFGDSDDEEEEEEEGVTPVSSTQSTPAKSAASISREINPFEKPPRPPPPTLDRRKLAAAKAAGTPPRPPEPPGLVREQRAGSLTSLSSSGKKKRPAPRPPGVGSSPSHSQGVSPAHSPSTLRKRHAPKPPPPPPVAVAAPAPAAAGAAPETPSPEQSKAEKEQDNYTKQVNNLTNKSIQGQFKRRKGPAPLRPKPIKRQVKTLPPKETQTELHDINIKQLELERQGVELEKTIRQLTEQDDKQQKELDSTAPYGLDIEDMILQLFELVNEKNALFRRQAELMYMRRQHRLEEEHAELEYEIRCLMMKADSLKSDMERQREQRLIERLVSVVEQRNEIVTMLEMERIREIQEDATIDHHMAERVGSVEPTPEKKKKKKKKKDKKEKEGSSKKKGRDDDKDIDEKEQATEKKKSKKIKLKKLFS